MPNDDGLLRETYRLAKENNKMLHAMRRSAFLSGLLKLIVWGALIIIPYWLYLQYLAPQLNQLMNTMHQIQGTGASAQAQIGDWQKAFDDLRSKVPGLSSTSSSLR